MATYGLQATPGTVPFTGWTNTLSASSAAQGSGTGAVAANGVTQFDAKLSQWLRNGAATLGVKQLLLTILGAAAGGTATKTKAQVVANIGSSQPAVETVNIVNRVTTAADITAFTALVNRTVFPSTYAPDLSGNGGGGKLGLY